MLFDAFAISVVVFLGLTPMVLSIWGIHSLASHPRLYRHRRRTRPHERWDGLAASTLTWPSTADSAVWLLPERFCGDTSCRFNAHSPFLRCAVNPEGPCQGCPFYEPSLHLSRQ
jgi:hypothetical protein